MKMMKKTVTMGIILLFVTTSINALPCMDTTNNATNSNKIVESNLGEAFPISLLNRGNQPLPPVMWTEDFYTFYISIPQDPNGDQIFYLIDWGDGTSSGWIGPFNSDETIEVLHDWSGEGTYKIKAKAKNNDTESKCTIFSLTLSSDINFFGVEIGFVDINYTFTIYWNEGCDCWIYIDWGDGTGEWIGPYEQPLIFAPRTWNSPGEYVLKIKLKDMFGNESEWITFAITILSLENNPPSKPYINGPVNAKIRMEHTYIFRASDSDCDNVRYNIDWGDGNHEWTDYYVQDNDVEVKHKYEEKGVYTVKVYAQDTNSADGPEATLEVTMPKNKFFVFNFPILNRLLDRFRNIFQY